MVDLTPDEKIQRLRAALEPFAGFYVWLEAAAALGEVEPLDDHSAVVSLSVAGGSGYIWMHHLREALKVLEATEEVTPTGLAPSPLRPLRESDLPG